jgi:hypothetical protein
MELPSVQHGVAALILYAFRARIAVKKPSVWAESGEARATATLRQGSQAFARLATLTVPMPVGKS